MAALIKLVIIIFVASIKANLLTKVTVSLGKLEGYVKQTSRGTNYVAFEGIPYARPPVGKLRFEQPKPMKHWAGTWQAKSLTTCMQYYHYTEPGEDWVRGQEDCLHLNVYTPNISSSASGRLKDVIVFIHGGAFMFNSGGTYGEKFLMEHGAVVYVSLNYRLGPLGFLSLENRLLPGNNGLKDQLLALKWIKENIRVFGGNPDNIMISGMSAGGASVHFHILSPHNHSLFNKAMMMSGSALNPWVLVEKSREKAHQLARIVGCPDIDTKEMLACLKYRPGRQIVQAVKKFQPWRYNPISPFGVVVDKWSTEPIVSEHPYRLLRKKDIRNIPVIFSNVQAEGLYPGAEFILDDCLEQINARFSDLIPHILNFNNTVTPGDVPNVCKKIRDFYFGDKNVNVDTFETLIKMMSDRLFFVDNERAARLHAAASLGNSYFYFNSYRAAVSKSNARTRSKVSYGTSHGDDTILVLSTDINTTSTESDREMSRLFQEMWLSFSKTGVPKMGNAKWEKMSTNSADPLRFLHIKSAREMLMESAESFGNRKEFWDSLPFKENQHIQAITKDEL